MYIACILNFFSYFPADTKMHPVLKNLGITDKVVSFVVDSVNGDQVKKRRARKLPAKRSNKASCASVRECALLNTRAHVSACVASGCGGKPSEACMMEG